MKKITLITLLLLFTGLGLAQADQFRGYVTALPCGPQGAQLSAMSPEQLEDAADAVHACVNEQEGKYAIYTNGATLVADSQEDASQNVGYEVRINGKMDGSSLKIECIEDASTTEPYCK